MRILFDVVFPIEPFNSLVRKGVVGELMHKILGATKPEAVYFTDHNGQRSALLVVDLADASAIPALHYEVSGAICSGPFQW